MADDKQKDAFMTVGGQTGMAGAAPGRRGLNRLSGCLIINFPPAPLSLALALLLPDFGSKTWGRAPCLLMLSGVSLSLGPQLKEARHISNGPLWHMGTRKVPAPALCP